MADRDDTSKPRSSRNQPTSFSPSLLQSALVQAIEAERAELLRVHSLIKCLYEVLLYSEDESHADSANVAARLIDESVTRLDIVRLGPMIEALVRGKPLEAPEDKLSVGFSGKDEVRDGGPLLLAGPVLN